ncbi:ProQ/FINO family protein [Klebsiella pneumoniae]
MASYTHHFLYQKAISTGGQRFDLTGQSCGEVTPEQQQAATVLVEKARERGNAHDKGQ